MNNRKSPTRGSNNERQNLQNKKTFSFQEYEMMRQKALKYQQKYSDLQKNRKQSGLRIEKQVRDLVSDQIIQLKSGIQLERYQLQIRIKDLQYQVKQKHSLLKKAQKVAQQKEKRIAELLKEREQGRPNPQKEHTLESKMKKQIDILEESNKNKSNKLKEQQGVIQSLKKNLAEEKAKSNKLNAEKLSWVILQKQLKGKIQKLSLNIQQNEKKSKQIAIELMKSKEMAEEYKEENDRLQAELESYQEDNRKLRIQKLKIDERISTLRDECKIQNVDSFEILQAFHQSIIHYKYFSDSKLFDSHDYSKRMYLINYLKYFLSIRSFKAQLLFRLDDINPTNFHKYIDGHQNILLLIGLSDGSVIGGFSVYPLTEENTKKQKLGKGFLFSSATQKVYPLKADAKFPVITYDQYYFIFGNSEIRIKTQDRTLFSNFGILSSTFNPLGDSSQQFLRTRLEGLREIQIYNYEFYKICQQ